LSRRTKNSRWPPPFFPGGQRKVKLAVNGDGFVSRRGRRGRTLGCARFADVDAALEEGTILDGDAGGDDIAGERTFRTDVDAVGGLAVAADLTENDDFAGTWPLRPTVTRFPGRLMVPSTLPSMNRDSEPESSPLMMRDLPMVACSPEAVAVAAPVAAGRAGAAGAGASKLVTGGVIGRCGSGVCGVEGPV
jgi:hypothetical protein